MFSYFSFYKNLFYRTAKVLVLRAGPTYAVLTYARKYIFHSYYYYLEPILFCEIKASVNLKFKLKWTHKQVCILFGLDASTNNPDNISTFFATRILSSYVPQLLIWLVVCGWFSYCKTKIIVGCIINYVLYPVQRRTC